MKKSELNEFLEKTIAMKFIKKYPFVEGLIISDEMWNTSHSYDFFFKLKINRQTLYWQLSRRDLVDPIESIGSHLEDFKSRFLYDLKNNDIGGYFILKHIIAEEAFENNRIITGIGHNAGEISSPLQHLVIKLMPVKRISIKKVAEQTRELIKDQNIKISVRSSL